MQHDTSIDWHEEWAKHAHGFHDGLAHIDFKELNIGSGSIVLAPGPGFGDLSHPTTRLVLNLMSKHVAGMSVLDIGCGSGILSLAAATFGAKSVFGLDIDDEAISHAIHNAALNGLTAVCQFGKSAKKPRQIILMNMIRSEQKAAYSSLPEKFRTFDFAFTSGILKEERQKYLTQTAAWGWKCIAEKQLKGWLGFCFTRV